MIPEIGHFALVLVLVLSALGFMGVFQFSQKFGLHELVAPSVVGQFVFATIAFACLVSSFLADDFSVDYVAGHSNTLLPWYYKISAAWGGHEGSFLLWILIMTGWMTAVLAFSKELPAAFQVSALGILCAINLGFVLFSLLTSNPFERLIPLTPSEGVDLNPLLQDFGLIVHPPMLYLGYVGLVVPFSFALAALITGEQDLRWSSWTKPWANVSWAFLTLGIALGSWWAYYELGWGGWWFWDPVENASFMPWLAATALLHSLSVTNQRGIFKNWSLLLAITAFSLSLLGAFIVRSGVLTSVHSFAVDPERGAFILAFLGLVVGGALATFALRTRIDEFPVSYSILSKEAFLLLNNGFWIFGLLIVLWGTLSPLAYEAITGAKISVGAPFFNAFFVPLGIALLISMSPVPMLAWKMTPRSRAKEVGYLCATVFPLVLILLLLQVIDSYTAVVSLSLGFLVVVTHVYSIVDRSRKKQKVTRSFVGMSVAHIGFAVCLIGIGTTSTTSVERDVRMEAQGIATIGPYEVRFLGTKEIEEVNYHATQGVFLISEKSDVFELRAEKRRYKSGGAIMTEAAIKPGLFSDMYISLGDPIDIETGVWAVRLHWKPFVRWIWFGAILMALGGLISVLRLEWSRFFFWRARQPDDQKDRPDKTVLLTGS